MKKILIHTQYFPPEVGAPQNRLYELAIRLKAMGIQVDVLTAMPNYPKMEIQKEYKRKFYKKENIDNLTVYRCWIYVSKKRTVFKRLLNYFSFVFSSFWIGIFKLKKYDYILCESPPLFLGITTYWLCKFKRAKLIFNVSDLWPESAEKLKIIENKFFLKRAYWLEKFLYKKSKLITGQTQGIVKNIKYRFPNKDVYWLPNGVDVNYYNPLKIESNWRNKNEFNNTDVLFYYGGIIGHAQGLEIILNAAKKFVENSSVKFIIQGDGPELQKLLDLKEELALNNVYFFTSVSKSEMPNILKAIDISIVPLKKLDLFLGAIPSKIFENLAMGNPILLGVDGEARDLFVEDGKCALFFEPENSTELVNRIKEIIQNIELREQLSKNAVKYVSKQFNRNTIAENFYKHLLSIEQNN